MAYTPENNPYIPGDPYSYDLKWLIRKIKSIEETFNSLIADVTSRIDDIIGSALTERLNEIMLDVMYDESTMSITFNLNGGELHG